MKKNLLRILASLLLLAVLVLGLAAPVSAFDGRGGNNVVVASGEVVDDDLYVGANQFTLEGTVKGDVLAGGRTITINGVVEGDVMAAGQTVIINGSVTGSVRIAGAALLITEKAKIGGDLVASGASLETQKGSGIGQDAVIFGGQALLAGDITRNARVFSGGAEVRGAIGGNLDARVGSGENSGPGPAMYIQQSPIAIPDVKNGLTVDPAAKIGGKLTYTSEKEFSIPDGVAAGSVTHIQPVVKTVAQPTLFQLLLAKVLDTLRTIITLILLGLLLAWLFPAFVAMNTNRIRATPLPALGWGIVSILAFFFAVLFLIVATVVGALLLRLLTLNGLSGSLGFLGLLGILVLVFGFVLATSFVAQILVSVLAGRLILEKVKPDWAEHRVWPLVIGVIIFALLAAVPFLGWLVNLLVILLGLGALWYYGRSVFSKPTPQLPAGL